MHMKINESRNITSRYHASHPIGVAGGYGRTVKHYCKKQLNINTNQLLEKYV